jgi:glutamyl-tRNA synthetase
MTRTRFAPSPTGELHIGGARTALFAYLFAKNQNGEFLLRIEDTDRERYVQGAEKRIIESLSWLGIVPDNLGDPTVQSKRLEIYKKHAFDLVNDGQAYICTCSKEKLAADREKQLKESRPPRYEGYCRDAKINIKNLAKDGYVVRMKMPVSGKIIVDDLIRGRVEFDSKFFDDQIILKSDGYPTYHLASVIDDHASEITHVIRSEEWLSSTPKHLTLYKMFGWKPPEFAHLSMILGKDKSKLSKRHGATSVLEYRDQGYLPEAIVNFIALLGWNPKDDRELFEMPELIREFKLENVNQSPAIFDIEKLNWMNREYMMSADLSALRSYLGAFGARELTDEKINLVKRGGYSTLKAAADYLILLDNLSKYEKGLLVFKKSNRDKTLLGLEKTLEKLSKTENWSEELLQKVLETVVFEEKLTNGDVFWPVRVALSGVEKSPSPTELLLALGKKESLDRIAAALQNLAD